jgi:hypothetical protein
MWSRAKDSGVRIGWILSNVHCKNNTLQLLQLAPFNLNIAAFAANM